jgi:hypothetical protein
MAAREREVFENVVTEVLARWPEVGSRAMQRLLIGGSEAYEEGWFSVQDGNYRFRVSQEKGVAVQIVLREYLACHVIWD